MPKATKTQVKQRAQEELMHGIGNVLGYVLEQQPRLPEELGISEEEFMDILKAQADRVARMFGYEEAWGN